MDANIEQDMKNALIIFGLFLGTTSLSQDISLVKDINTTPVNYYDIENMFAFQDMLYFSFLQNTYVYDGIDPPKFAFGIRPIEPYEYDQKLYFSSYDLKYKARFWQYDGLNPPQEIAHFDFHSYGFPHNFAAYNDKLYFALDDDIHGDELWVYDFANPPVLAADIYPGEEGSDPSGFITYGNKLYFIAGGRELWTIDGANPPVKFMDLGWGRHSAAVVNNKLCFAADDEEYGRELFEYDGVNSPMLTSDIVPGIGTSDPEDLYVINDILYFTTSDSILRFWQYDGIIAPVPSIDLNANISGSPGTILKKINGKLYFTSSIRDTTGYKQFLWVFDGISLRLIVGMYQTSDFFHLTEAGGILYFNTHVPHSHAILWSCDGINPPVKATLNSTAASYPNNLGLGQS
jgi:ELWxxDGT repeat protein